MLGGHLDSFGGPGANENATGCAVLLELARVLKNNNKTVPNVQFIFFGGEEIATGASADDHHWGSRYFVTTMSETDRSGSGGYDSRGHGRGPAILTWPTRWASPGRR